MNKILLHLEGVAILLLSLYFYSYNQFSWLLFFVLLLAPDISMIGYLFNNKVGAVLYNSHFAPSQRKSGGFFRSDVE